MKEAAQVSTPTGSPCKVFVPHRFKVTRCVHCFKSKSQHPQYNQVVAERISENVQLIAIQSNRDMMPGSKGKPSHRKHDTRTNNKSNGYAEPNSDNLLEDGVLDRSMLAGKTRQLRRQFESQDAKVKKQQPLSRSQMHKNGAIHSSSSPQDDFIMNIPIETSIPQTNDLNSNSNHNGAINEHYLSDSDNEILSEPVSSKFWRAKWSPRPTRAMDPIPSVISDVDAGDQSDEEDEAGIPVLKSVHQDKQEISLPDKRLTGNGLNEFQRIAKCLRHVDPPPDSPQIERKPINSPRSQGTARLVQDDDDDDDDYLDLDQDALPINVESSSSRASNDMLTNHDRQTSDTELFESTRKEGMHEVTVQNRGENTPPEINQVTRNKTSPEKSGGSPTKPKDRRKADYSPMQIPQLDHSGKPVTIISRDGNVSYYNGSPTPFRKTYKSEDSLTSQQSTPTETKDVQSPTAKPYVVVDISSNPPQGLSTHDRRSISGPPLPCTPAPRSRPSSQRSSHSFDSSDDDLRHRAKDSSRFSKRSSAHIDGTYPIGRSNSLDSTLTDNSTETESDISPVKHSSGTGSTPESKMLTDDSKRNTPPFPMLLTDQTYEAPAPSVKKHRDRNDRRRSSGSSHYKVPIFIQPQNYDNLGTVKSDSDTKLNEIPSKTPEKESAPKPPMRTASQDYLMPMTRDSLGSQNSTDLEASIQSPESRDSGFSVSDTESRTSKTPLPVLANNHEEFRSRAQSHPPIKAEPVYAKISHEGKKLPVTSKQKRTAPAPPLNELDEQAGFTDTLPRSAPPPPPVSKEKRGSSDSLVVDLSQQVTKRHATNIYSQPPQRRPSSDPSKGNKPERPKPLSPQANSDRGVVQSKTQAPVVRTEFHKRSSSESARKLSSEFQKKSSSESTRKSLPEPPTRPSTESPQKACTESTRKSISESTTKSFAESQRKSSSESTRKSSESPTKSSTESPRKASNDISRNPSYDAHRKSSTESSTKTNVDRPSVVSPQRKHVQSVRVQSPAVKRPTSPTPNSAPAGTKDMTPTKGKAPVPSQIHNVLSPRNSAQNPPKNQNLKQDKAPSAPGNRAPSVPGNRAPSPLVKRTKSPLQIEVPLQNGSASPPPTRSETPAKAVSINANSRSAESNSSSSPPTRTISPLPPNSPILGRPGHLPLPDHTITGSPTAIKSKKVKLPWKRRKRKEDGSPEREFNAEPVQKWLDEIQKMQLEDIKTNRHSLERLDVINAYKGQPTATIKQKIEPNGTPISQSPAVQTASANVDNPDGPIPRPRKNSALKRQAPRPPSVLEDIEDKVEELEEVPLLQKSYSLSPTGRRKRRGSAGDNGNVYENVGFQRKEGAPPNKPTRRVRNRTTAFEDLPSQKRIAPKAPEEEEKLPLCRKTSLSDQDLRQSPRADECPVAPPRSHQSNGMTVEAMNVTLLSDQDLRQSPPAEERPVAPPRSHPSNGMTVEAMNVTPLKSAMKNRGSEGSKRFDQDGRPRRPVRILLPRAPDENSNDQKTNTSIFDNLEYLLTSDLKMDEKASLDSFYGPDKSAEMSLSSPSADATVQCSLSTSNNGNAMNAIFNAMLEMNSRTLAAVGSAWKAPPGTEWWSDGTKWGDLIGEEAEACCSGDAVFYPATHGDHPDNPVAVMISLNLNHATDVLQVAEFSKSISPHCNLFTIHHEIMQSVPSQLIGSHQSASPPTSESGKLLDRAVVAMDKLPVTSLSYYVTHNKEQHQYLPEKYEHDMALMLLQLCSALHHLELHHISLQNIKLEHVVLVETNLPGSGLQLVLNHLLSELHHEQSEGGKIILASKEQIEERTGEFSLGILVYELLHQRNPFATKTNLITQDYKASDLPTIPDRSKYSKFLHHLATQFLTKAASIRLTANQGALALQTMLWGPQVDQLPLDAKDPRDLEQALQQWLLLEQSRVVNKMAQASVQSLTHRDAAFGLKDQLQCQFLSKACVASLKEGLTLLYFTKN